MNDELKHHESINESLTKEVQELKCMLGEAKEVYRKNEMTLEERETSIKTLEEDKLFLSEEGKCMKEELEGLNEQVHSLEDQLREAQEVNRNNDLMSLEVRDTFISNQEQEKLAFIEEKKCMIDELKHHESINESLTKEVQELKCILEDAQEVYRKNEMTLEERETSIKTLEEEKLLLSEEGKCMKEEREGLNEQVHSLEDQLREAQEVNRNNDLMSLEEKDTFIRNQEQEKLAFIEEKKCMSDELKHHESINESLSKEVQELKCMLGEAQEVYRKNEMTLEERDTYIRSLEEEKFALTEENEDMTDEISNHVSIIQSLKRHLQKVQEVYRTNELTLEEKDTFIRNQEQERLAFIEEKKCMNDELKHHESINESLTKEVQELKCMLGEAQEVYRKNEMTLEERETSIKTLEEEKLLLSEEGVLIAMGFLSRGIEANCNSNPHSETSDFTSTLMEPFLNVNNIGRPF
ncbi:golgin subfamily A member 6-like protein 22 [Labrus bergylta]|uniref:golgin subfamily A member 6-like protein 22 n=1 Tax=Labrus bergylta TaxID=56723 RepID=UPI003313E526